MITDENDPQMVFAHQELLSRLGTVLGSGRRLDKYLMQKMFDVVKDHKEQCRQRGLDFPALVALVIPRLGVVEWKRADLDIESIRTTIINFVREHQTAGMEEVVQAFRAAWPRLHPDDFRTTSDVIMKAVAKKTQSGESA